MFSHKIGHISKIALCFAILSACGGAEEELFQYTALRFDETRACFVDPSNRVVVFESSPDDSSYARSPECKYDAERNLIMWTNNGLIDEDLGFVDCDLVPEVPAKFENPAFGYDAALVEAETCE